MLALGYVQGSEAASDDARSGVVLHERGAAWPGLNLVVSAHAPEARLLDMHGRELHRWSRTWAEVFPERPAPPPKALHHRYWRRARILPDGSLLAVFENHGLVKLDRDSNVVWVYREKTHHDVAVAADGTLWALIRARRRLPAINPFRPVLDDYVVELSPEGEERRRVSVFDALKDSLYADWLDSARERGHDDLFHTNSIVWLGGDTPAAPPAFRAGGLLLSVHGVHGIAVLDPDAREIAWGLRGSFRFQHEASLLTNGHLLLFDNTGAGERSRVLELDPASGAPLWSYEHEGPPVFFTLCCGTAQRLPNGNTLITETEKGRAFEVDSQGRLVWEYRTPHRVGPERETLANLFEVRRVPEEFVAAWLGRTGADPRAP